jgi:hypothetical protein
VELSNEPRETGPSSQAQPLEISSDSEVSRISDLEEEPSDGEPRRSGRVKKASRTI